MNIKESPGEGCYEDGWREASKKEKMNGMGSVEDCTLILPNDAHEANLYNTSLIASKSTVLQTDDALATLQTIVSWCVRAVLRHCAVYI